MRDVAGTFGTLAMRARLLVLLCAVTLTVIPGALIGGQVAHATPQSTFYGIPDNLLLAATDTPTNTATALTATDTPTTAPTASATATPSVTDTPTATNTPAPTATPTNTPTPAPTATLPPCPATNCDVAAAATAAGWPQINGNWCGIATVALIADFLNPKNPISQNAVAGMLSGSSSISEWGTPPWNQAYGTPGVTADIAEDFGTDPRSLAYGMTMATGRSYHMVVDTGGAWDATVAIVRTIIMTGQPVSVFVDHGQHSVIVSGVDVAAPGDNPLTNPSSITYIHVWDPGNAASNSGIQRTMSEPVPLNTWLSGYSDGGGEYFKHPYSNNPIGSIQLDPDPSVGPYTFVPALYNHLWVGHYVWISPYGPYFGPTSPDWAVTPGGVLIAGEPSTGWPTTPAGYTGATVPMPTNPPPPPPPVHVFSKKPLPKPVIKVVPKPKPTPTPRPTPRPRSSPTPIPPASNVTALPIDPVTPTQSVCSAFTCALASLPPLWGMALIVVLLLGALALSLAMLRPRRRRRPAQAALAVAGAPILPSLGLAEGDGLAADVAPTAHHLVVEPQAEAGPAAPPEASTGAADGAVGPLIVPVLEPEPPTDG